MRPASSPGARCLPAVTRTRVLLTGASGLIGSAVTARLASTGSEVVRLVRRPPRDGAERFWDPERGTLDPESFAGVDAVVHLAGASVGEGRWTAARKRELYRSRVEGTRLLCERLAQLAVPPRVLVSASGVGYYGDRAEATLVEASEPGEGFLATLGRDWEAATATAEERGVRVVRLRTGLVLTREGGALAELLPLFRLGLGGPLGSGRQWWSWITIADYLAVMDAALADEHMRGAVNVVSPGPVRNAEFARTLGRVLHRPALLPAPALALRIILGREKANEMLLTSTRAEPRRLLDLGFRFRHPELEPALRSIVGS